MSISLHPVQHKALEEELRFHKEVYELQLGYVESLFTAMRFICSTYCCVRLFASKITMKAVRMQFPK